MVETVKNAKRKVDPADQDEETIDATSPHTKPVRDELAGLQSQVATAIEEIQVTSEENAEAPRASNPISFLYHALKALLVSKPDLFPQLEQSCSQLAVLIGTNQEAYNTNEIARALPYLMQAVGVIQSNTEVIQHLERDPADLLFYAAVKASQNTWEKIISASLSAGKVLITYTETYISVNFSGSVFTWTIQQENGLEIGKAPDGATADLGHLFKSAAASMMQNNERKENINRQSLLATALQVPVSCEGAPYLRSLARAIASKDYTHWQEVSRVVIPKTSLATTLAAITMILSKVRKWMPNIGILSPSYLPQLRAGPPTQVCPSFSPMQIHPAGRIGFRTLADAMALGTPEHPVYYSDPVDFSLGSGKLASFAIHRVYGQPPPPEFSTLDTKVIQLLTALDQDPGLDPSGVMVRIAAPTTYSTVMKCFHMYGAGFKPKFSLGPAGHGLYVSFTRDLEGKAWLNQLLTLAFDLAVFQIQQKAFDAMKLVLDEVCAYWAKPYSIPSDLSSMAKLPERGVVKRGEGSSPTAVITLVPLMGSSPVSAEELKRHLSMLTVSPQDPDPVAMQEENAETDAQKRARLLDELLN